MWSEITQFHGKGADGGVSARTERQRHIASYAGGRMLWKMSGTSHMP